jgi:hypothetical protein
MLLREERRALLLKSAENVLAFDEVFGTLPQFSQLLQLNSFYTSSHGCMECFDTCCAVQYSAVQYIVMLVTTCTYTNDCTRHTSTSCNLNAVYSSSVFTAITPDVLLMTA